MSEPTDKELFRRCLFGAIACIFGVIFCILVYPYYYLSLTFLILSLSVPYFILIFSSLGVFSFMMYIIKPNFYRKRLLKAWEKRQKKKNQKKK